MNVSLGASMRLWVALTIVLLGFACLAGCSAEPGGTPSVVGHSWEIQIGGVGELPPPATTVEFVGLADVDFRYDRRIPYPPVEVGVPHVPPPVPMLTVSGETSFSLPGQPLTLEVAQAAGVKIAAMTYCGFINAAGEPREEDLAAVATAMDVFESAVVGPMRNAPLTEEGLWNAGAQAAESLLESVLDEFERRGVRDPAAQSPLVRLLGIYTSPDGFAIELEDLVDFLPSLVWTFGDSTTRATLTGCGALMLFDVSEQLRRMELPFPFPGFHCRGNNSAFRSLACSLEAFLTKRNEDRQEAAVLTWEALDQRDYSSWVLVPEVSLTPF